jgi:AAA15 family ATPase/GTPase
MLTRLKFKNWRSLKDAEIEFKTPITVFIGANSSGKTNILDGLHFLRDLMMHDKSSDAVYYQWERRKIHTLNVTEDIPIELELDFEPAFTDAFKIFTGEDLMTYKLLIGHNQYTRGILSETLISRLENKIISSESSGLNGEIKAQDGYINMHTPSLVLPIYPNSEPNNIEKVKVWAKPRQLYLFMSERWQLFRENFIPPLSVPIDKDDTLYPYILDPHAANLSLILEFLRRQYPELYTQLQDDIVWLLGHVDSIEAERTERETRFFVREKGTKGEAPTISAGTARVIAMLASFYVLDMRYPKLPGLVAIEEPDTALNPLLLKNFVEQLRNYTEREGHPRQIILTTHNPMFLNYFEAEEVRIIERDENGYTQVSEVPDDIKEIWLQKHTLGEAWMSRVLGGVPSL